MFYIPELLSKRKKGKLARCWLAGILGEGILKKTFSKKALMLTDIGETCDEILKMVNTERERGRVRCSLYLSSQLMYGAAKLLLYQTNSLEDELFRVQKTLQPSDTMLHKKMHDENFNFDATDVFNLPDPPPFDQSIDVRQFRTDVNLLPEEDIIRDNTRLDEPLTEWMTFGELTADEMDLMLLTEDVNLLELDERYANMFDRPEHLIHAVNDFTNSPRRIPETPHKDSIPAVSNFTDSPRRIPGTPQKRGTIAAEVDTPTKRRRRSLIPEMEGTVRHEITVPPKPDDLTEIPIDVTEGHISDFPMHQPVENIDVVLPEPAIPPADQTTIPSDLQLDSLEQEEPRPQRVRRPRSIRRIDQQLMLPTNELRRFIANVNAHTIDKTTSTAVPVFRIGIPASVLLVTPASHYLSFSQYNRQVKKHTWNNALYDNFERHTRGKFHAETDLLLNVDTIRFMDSGIQQQTTTSSRLGKSTIHEKSSKNKTTDTVLQINLPEPMIPEVTEEIHIQPIDIDLPDVPEENIEITSKMPSVSISKQADFTVASIHPVPGTINGKSATNTDSGDIDEFLPPNLKTINIKKQAQRAGISISENIVDAICTPSSVRSQVSSQPNWCAFDLMSELEVRWRDNTTVEFRDLVSQETNTTFDAASCFSLLLELHHQKKVILTQAGCFKPIFISRYEKN